MAFFNREEDLDGIAKSFAKNQNMNEEEIRQKMHTNPTGWKKDLDSWSAANSKHKDRFNPEVGGKVDEKNMRKLKGYKKSIIPDRMRRESEVDRLYSMHAVDTARDNGQSLYGRGASGGWGETQKQAKSATFSQKFSNLARHVNPLGGSSRESLGSSIGFAGRDAKILASKGSKMEALGARVLTPGFGAFMAYSALSSEDPFAEYTAGIVGGAAVQQGWRVGKALGNFTPGASHLARISMGTGMAVAATTIGVGAVLAQNDLFSNESFIGKQAKKLHRKETFNMYNDTEQSLTMRQAGLRKLSSSHLNNREQLLGNEAGILRNSQV